MHFFRNMTESIKLAYMREILKEKFQVTHDLPGVFFDPHALMHNDQEKIAVENHTSALWNFAKTKEDFGLKSIEDVLEQLYFYQKQTKSLVNKNVGFQTMYA